MVETVTTQHPPSASSQTWITTNSVKSFASFNISKIYKNQKHREES